MKPSVSIWTQLVDFGRRVEIGIHATETLANGDARRLVGQLTWRETADADVFRLPDEDRQFMTPTDAQYLIDSLWACGLRPTAAAGSAGQLDAVKYHLEDMRKLVFQK